MRKGATEEGRGDGWEMGRTTERASRNESWRDRVSQAACLVMTNQTQL